MERCSLGPFSLPTTTLCGGVGLGWFSASAEGPEDTSALKLSLAGGVGVAAEEGLIG